MLLTSGLTLALAVSCVFIHYEALRLVSCAMPAMKVPPRRRLQLIIGVALLAHILEIALFALAFAAMENQLGLGEIVGPVAGDWLDYFYFSAASYTTLGMGDLLPTGGLRLTASLQSLLGLVLIGWTASFTYLAMQEFWDLHQTKNKQDT